MKRDSHWKQYSYRYLFKSKWYNLRQDKIRLPCGEKTTYTTIEHPGFSMVVPFLPDGRIILERIYRYTIDKAILECPSGGLDSDSPEDCAKRELLEETGYEARDLYPIGSFYGSTGISDERFYLFIASDLNDTGCFKREPTEEIELEFVRFEDAVEMAFTGEIVDAPSALAIILAHQKISNGLIKI